MTTVPLPDHGIPALDSLINGGLWARWVDEGRVFPVGDLRRAIRYVRLKPFASCRLTVFDDGAGSPATPPPGFVVRLFSDADGARQAYEKERTRRHTIGSAGHGPFLDERHSAVAVPFPNDPDVPGLRHVYRAHRLKTALQRLLPNYSSPEWRIRRSLTDLRLLAYKPGRRAVFRVTARIERTRDDRRVTKDLLVKVESPSNFGIGQVNGVVAHRAVSDDAAWRVPRPVGVVAERQISAVEWIDGTPLAAANRWSPESFRMTGQALAELHDLNLPLPFKSTTTLAPTSLRRLSRDLAALLPSESTRILRLGDRLSRLVDGCLASPLTGIHGDFHPEQVLVCRKQPVLVDLDRAGRGHAAVDVGNFLAQIAAWDAADDLGRAFVAGYRERRLRRPGDATISAAIAAGTFRLAVFPFRRLAPDWPARTTSFLDAVERRLADSGPAARCHAVY